MHVRATHLSGAGGLPQLRQSVDDAIDLPLVLQRRQQHALLVLECTPHSQTKSQSAGGSSNGVMTNVHSHDAARMTVRQHRPVGPTTSYEQRVSALCRHVDPLPHTWCRSVDMASFIAASFSSRSRSSLRSHRAVDLTHVASWRRSSSWRTCATGLNERVEGMVRRPQEEEWHTFRGRDERENANISRDRRKKLRENEKH